MPVVFVLSPVPFIGKEEARLDRTLCPVKVEKNFLLTKDIKANQLVAITINLMKVSLFCIKDIYFTCNLG